MKIYRPVIEDELELCNADGVVVERLPFSIDVNKSYKKIISMYAGLAAQSKAAEENPENTEAQERLGRMFWDLCRECFGEDIAEKLTQWYSDEAMLAAFLAPILIEKIYPLLLEKRGEIMEIKTRLSRYAEQTPSD